jgi:hypothetical protein
MATRMQQRRGTAAQWTSTNAGAGPVLNAGEIGWESDTNRFKIGDGVNNWSNLDYFADINSTINPAFGTSITFEGATADSYETILQVTDPTADRTITFPDATGTVALTSDIAELSQDAIDTALTAGTGITKTYNDNANTLTLAVDTTTIQARVADVSDTEIGYLNGVTSAIQTQIDAKAPTANASFTGTFSAPSGTITSDMITNGTIVDADINASAAIALSKLATDPLARANHSGSQTASTISDFDTQVRTSKVTDLTAPTGSFSMNSQKITSLATPTDSTDAATKAYVDAVTEGLHIHPSVVAATTANVALASALENGDTLDGVTLATGNRILVKNQTTTSENGIYVVQASGQPSRATDFDTALEVDSGDFVFVSSGTANAATGWVQTSQPATIGTDPITFTQFSGAGTYSAGTGLTLTGNVFSANIGTDIQAYNSTLAAVAGGTYTGDDSITTLGTVSAGTWNGTTIAIANGGTGATTASTAAAALLPAQASNSGKYLTTDGSGTLSWGTVSGYSAPTLGSTSIASGATVTTIAGLTLSGATLTGSLTAGGGTGTSGQVLSSTGSGIQWITASAGVDEILVLMDAL